MGTCILPIRHEISNTYEYQKDKCCCFSHPPQGGVNGSWSHFRDTASRTTAAATPTPAPSVGVAKACID